MFNPLNMLRDLRSDHQLTSAEKLVLICAALRADNQTGRVRGSQDDLAEDAGLSRRTVVRVLQSKSVARYLTIVQVHRRRTDLFWKAASVTLSVTLSPPSVTQSHTECDTVAHHLPLSTLTSTSTSMTNGSMDPMTMAPVAPMAPREPLPDEYQDEDEYLQAHLLWKIENLDWIMAHRPDGDPKPKGDSP